MSDPESNSNYKILGFNLLAFAIYTVLFFASSNNGFVAAFFLACLHFVICVILAIAEKKWIWFLSGLLILLIGFGTCVSFGKLDLH